MTTAADRLWTRLERLPLMRRTKRTVTQVRAVAVEVGALVDAIWRRSLQVRVVVSTLALSAAVVLVLGLVLQTQIAGRILQGKEVDALGQAEAGAAVLERELAGVDPDGEGAQGELNKALDRLTNASLSTDPGSPSAGEFRAVLTTGPREPGGGVDGSGADEVSAGTVADVPADLRNRPPGPVHERQPFQPCPQPVDGAGHGPDLGRITEGRPCTPRRGRSGPPRGARDRARPWTAAAGRARSPDACRRRGGSPTPAPAAPRG